jgi:aldehyde dehydrogenase (NAD+)
LALYLFAKSKNLESRFLRGISSGGVCINDTISHVAAEHLPFGGVGESGSGNYHGKQTFLAFTHAKSILKKKGVDPPMKFPPYKKSNKWIKWIKKLF